MKGAQKMVSPSSLKEKAEKGEQKEPTNKTHITKRNIQNTALLNSQQINSL